MTLKEFSAKHLPLPKGEPEWRKAFPTQLRERMNDDGGWFIFRFKERSKTIEEKWERIHAGEVIDTEWRELEEYWGCIPYEY